MTFMNIPLTFAVEVPANNILYIILWVLAGEEEQESIVQQKKIMVVVGIEHLTLR
jgi:hypothetical protein